MQRRRKASRALIFPERPPGVSCRIHPEIELLELFTHHNGRASAVGALTGEASCILLGTSFLLVLETIMALSETFPSGC
jgi:hypothetical protein